MSPLNSYASGHGRQRGAIGLLAAMTLALAVLCMLVVVDSGRLYLEKRSLQRVADVAALEAASRKGNCLIATALDKQAATYVSQSALRNGFTVNLDGRALSTHCGSLAIDANGRRTFTADSSKTEAIQVTVSHSVPRSIAAGIGAMFDTTPTPVDVQLSATAVAAQAPPLAALTIRSAVLNIDSATASILNPIFSGLIGGSLNLSVASWQSLVDGKVNLLSYLNRLKTDLNLTAVGYTQVLGNSISIGQLIDSAIHVLNSDSTLDSTTTIASLNAVKLAAGATNIVLGDLLKIQSSSDIAALSTTLGLFDLVQGAVQVANKKNGLIAPVQINLPNIAQITARVQVIEPPQISAIGDPAKVNPADPLGNGRISVQTAQLRGLVSINLPLLGGVTTLVNAATGLLTPLTPLISSTFNLDLNGILGAAGCLLSTCQVSDFQLLPSDSSPGLGPRIDLSLDLGAAKTYVTGYTCASATDKTLTTHTEASLINLKIGQIDSASAFPTSTAVGSVNVQPLAVIDIGTKTCPPLFGNCYNRKKFGGGGIGISADSGVPQTLSTTGSLNYLYKPPYLPEINMAPGYPSPAVNYSVLPSSQLLSVVNGLQVHFYQPTTSNVLSNILGSVEGLIGTVTNELNKIIKPALADVIDPLLKALGVTLAPAEVGANLSCNFGQATLVI